MKQIFKQIDETIAQYNVGLISKIEMQKIIAKLEFQLMGCDS
jgi:hypothetical protein